MTATHHNTRNDDIQQRFFHALQITIQQGQVRDLATFCATHHLNRVKYSRLRHQTGAYRHIDLAALAALCDEGNISPSWLLLGSGPMIHRDP